MKRGTLIRLFCRPPVCLCLSGDFISRMLGYIELKSNLWCLDFLKKSYFYIYLKKDMAVCIAKNAYFDIIKEIEINSVFSVDLEL